MKNNLAFWGQRKAEEPEEELGSQQVYPSNQIKASRSPGSSPCLAKEFAALLPVLLAL